MLEEIYSKITNHKDFVKKGYFVHLFNHLSPSFDAQEVWQLGFYDHDTGIITTYKIEGDDLIVNEGKPFRKDSGKINELILEDVKIELDKLREIVEDFQKKTYPGQNPIKIIAILQNIEGEDKILWNLTLITQSFNTLNIKVDAVSGEVISSELINLMQWDAG